MRIAIIYDCLFPHTVGGAERWYRNLAISLASQGHAIDYLTLRQWPRGEAPEIPGVRVIDVAPRMALYAAGKRRILPPLVFGIGIAWYLFRHGGRYDRIHTASFPFFALLAAGFLRPFFGYAIAVDWHEVWTRAYWRSYLGRLGWVGWMVQKLCARVPQQAFAFSRLHLDRLGSLGRYGTLLPGEYAGSDHPTRPPGYPPTVLYAGRLIAEKRVNLLVDAFAQVACARPELRLRIVGQGPEREALTAQVARLGLEDAVEFSGFVDEAQIARWMSEALAICQPSEREGYGMIVAEASAHGVPAIVVEGEDNAAVELVDEGANGLVSAASPAALAAVILGVADDPARWRTTSRAWYAANRVRLSLDHSLALVAASIAEPRTPE